MHRKDFFWQFASLGVLNNLGYNLQEIQSILYILDYMKDASKINKKYSHFLCKVK